MGYKRAIVFLFLFIAVIAIVDRSLSFLFSEMYRQNRYGMSGGNINYYMSMKKCDVLIMGSSRAHHTLIPDSISNSCYNLSHNGMSFGFHSCLVNILSQEDKMPARLLILEVEPENFVGKNPKLLYDVQFLKNYYNEDAFLRKSIDRIGPFEFTKFYFHLFLYNGTLPSLINNYFKTRHGRIPDTGYEPLPATLTDSVNTLKSAKDYDKKDHAQFFEYTSFDSSDGNTFLDNVVDICRKNKIVIVLFTAPYFNKLIPKEFIASFNTYLNNKGIIYFDFVSESQTALSHPGLWKDYAHLNSKGASIFSGLFSRKLKEAGLTEENQGILSCRPEPGKD